MSQSSNVYFTDMRVHANESIPTKLRKLIESAGIETIDFEGKYTAIKMHFGERGNLAFLRPNYAKVIVDEVKSLGGRPFLTDCSTLYVGMRSNALDHLDQAMENGFSPYSTGCQIVIGDGLRGTDDVSVPVNGGTYVKEAQIGRAIMDADVFISLTHFKGHENTGFGGALKNIGMGCGSRAGKMEQHYAGKPSLDTDICIGCGNCIKSCAQTGALVLHDRAEQELSDVQQRFEEQGLLNAKGKIRSASARYTSIDHDRCVGCGRCLGVCPVNAIKAAWSNDLNDPLGFKIAEYTKAVVEGRPCFHISLVIDVSPECDCFGRNDVPIVPGIGMFASFDPVALDVACADAVNAQHPNPGSELAEHIAAHGSSSGDYFSDIAPNTHWRTYANYAEKIGLGTTSYQLVEI